ncbi:MAG: hypothetical protein ACYCYO_20785 [Bacilli bacterium]
MDPLTDRELKMSAGGASSRTIYIVKRNDWNQRAFEQAADAHEYERQMKELEKEEQRREHPDWPYHPTYYIEKVILIP